MSSFFSLFSLSHIGNELIRTTRRFPLSGLLILCVSSILLYLIYNGVMIESDISDTLMRIVFTGSVTFFLSTALVLALEQYSSLRFRSSIMSILGVCAFAGFYYRALDMNPFDTIESTTMIFLTFFCFFAFLFFAPFLGLWKRYQERDFARYFYAIATILLMSVIIGGAIMILGSIALWSIDILFDMDFDDAYGYLAVIAFSLIAPFFGLSLMPEKSMIEDGKGSENVFFIFLVKYVALPFITFYFIILYVYSIKVLFHFSDWPNGQVSWMVIGFSVFGYLIYIFSSLLAEQNSLIQKMRQYFPMIVIPQIAMLFYAIYLRIAQYDLTMNRYFVVVFGLWLLGISLYFSFVKSARLVIIPMTLAVIICIISFGPWSVYHLPYARQEARLMHDLTTAGIYRDGVIIPLEKYTSIDPALSNDIYQGIGYVCGYDECRRIRELFHAQIMPLQEEKAARWQKSEEKYQSCILSDEEGSSCYREEYSKELSVWEIQSRIADMIHVNIFPYNGNSIVSPTISYGVQEDIFPLTLSGYDMILKISGDANWQSSQNMLSINPTIGKGELIVGGKVVEVFGLDALKKTLIAFYDENPGADTLRMSKDQMTFTLDGQVYQAILILQSINLDNPAYSGAQMTSPFAEGYALIRKK